MFLVKRRLGLFVCFFRWGKDVTDLVESYPNLFNALKAQVTACALSVLFLLNVNLILLLFIYLIYLLLHFQHLVF